MITLNTERGLVHIESWDDVVSLPGFTPQLDPTTATLDAIIGSYLMPDEVSCGLSNCRQPHNRGYVVTTKDGRTTNLGKDCGKRHFSVEFETMRGKFDRDLRRSQQREQLHTAKLRVDILEAEIATLRRAPRGADWLHKKSTALLSRTVLPSYIVTTLSEMARKRSPSITMEREATFEEAQQLEVLERRGEDRERHRIDVERPQRKRYVTDEVGQLDGVAALYGENDLRDVVVDLTSGLTALRALDVDSLTDTELSHHSKWTAAIDEKLDHLRSSIKIAQRLFEPRNIAQLADLARSRDDQRAVAEFARSLKSPSTPAT